MRRLLLGVFMVCVVIAVTGPPTVSTASDPVVVGQWSSLIPWPHVGVHAHLLNTGEVLTFHYGSTATLWNPATGVFSPTPNNLTDLFCAGHTFLADGRLITLGGWERSGGGLGVTDTDLFSPLTRTWTKVASMAYRRWYPTGTILPDGRVLVTSGDINSLNDIAAIPEIYDPSANNWTSLPQATKPLPVYPFMFVLPNGRVLSAGSSEVATITEMLDVGTRQWTTVDPVAVDGGSAVMFAPGKILKAGTAADSGNNGNAARTAYVLDMTRPTPAWRATGSMAFIRAFLNLTALPDGTVLATGGGTDRSSFNTANAIKEAEIWSPSTETWTTMAALQAPRLYHSTALLLPDARVLVTGGGADAGVADQQTGEIFSPPYLFKGARPAITSSPSALAYGSDFFLGTPDGANIQSVSLIGTASVTHAFNMSQRFTALSFQATDGGLTVTAPANAALATPGYYLLFIVNSNGVPSVGAFVNLPTAPPPPAPTKLVATANQSTVSLTWVPPSGGSVVAHYNVYRSTVGGFVPSGASLIGQSATLAYADSGLFAGTYFYRVIAVDGAGTSSPASNEASATIAPPPGGAPLAVDKVVFSDGPGLRVTPAFSTAAAGELLLAFAASDGSGTQTLTVSGAGLTWSLVRRVNVQAGTSEIWKAMASARLTNVTVTATQANAGFYQSLTVVAFSGAAGTGATGGASASTGAPAVSLTTMQPGSLVYGVGNDWDRAVARTAAIGQVIVHQYLATAGDTMWVQEAGRLIPAAGTPVSLNDTGPTTDRWNLAAVEIVPSGPPPPPVLVPNVVNLTQAAASAALVAANLATGAISQASSGTIQKGYVISHTPTADTPVPPGTKVDLIVSSGPPPIAVPNVVNQPIATATDWINAAGLFVGSITSQSSATVAADSVISQSPAAGSPVAPGSSVDLVISSGPPPTVSVPDVVNLTQGAATTKITDALLKVGTVTNESSTTVTAGVVIRQSPAALSPVPAGSSVDIVVSSGPPPVGPVVDKVVFSDGKGTRTTSAFSTASANETLVAFVGSDGPAAAQTVTVSGAGLTWTLVKRVNVQRGTSEIWKATATTLLSNVTVRSTQSATNYNQSLTVVTFAGTGGVGASAVANAAVGAPKVSLTTTKAGSVVYGVGNDWDKAIARTPAAGQAIVHQFLAPTGDTMWVQNVVGPVAVVGTVVQISDTGPTTDRWNLAAVEIVP